MPASAVQFSGVTKRLGGKPVLSEVELDIPENRAVAVIGHNASGKTTLLNIMSTLWAIDGGDGSVMGLDLRKKKGEIRRRVGYAAHDCHLYAELSVEENLRFFARLYGVGDSAKRIPDMIEWFQVGAYARSLVRELSAGYRKRVSIIKALLHQPDLLLLDEPFANLDPSAKGIVEEAVRAFASVGTVVMTAHSLEGVPLFVKEKVFLRKGRVAKQDEASLLTSI